MESFKKYQFLPTEAKYLLTLRYNPIQPRFLPKISSSDLFPKNNSSSIDFIQKCIENSIHEKIEKTRTKKIMITLSSGVDSTLVFGIIKKLYPSIDIETLSVKFSESEDETNSAIKIAEKHNSQYHIIEINHLFEELPKAISIMNQPFWDLHMYYVIKKASKISNLLISGDGGDELFGGYSFRYAKFLSLITPNSTVYEKIHAYLECHERDNVPDQSKIFTKKMNFNWELIHQLLEPYFNNQLSPLEQVFLADYNGKLLHNFSPINYYLSNYFQIDSFSPLLSSELISYSMKIPIEEKYDQKNNLGKLILRNLLKKLDLDKFVGKQKLGFSINTKNYWNLHAKRICQDFLLDSEISKDGWISQNWITKYIQKEDLDFRYVNKFFGLLAFEIWYRLFISKNLNPNSKL